MGTESVGAPDQSVHCRAGGDEVQGIGGWDHPAYGHRWGCARGLDPRGGHRELIAEDSRAAPEHGEDLSEAGVAEGSEVGKEPLTTEGCPTSDKGSHGDSRKANQGEGVARSLRDHISAATKCPKAKPPYTMSHREKAPALRMFLFVFCFFLGESKRHRIKSRSKDAH